MTSGARLSENQSFGEIDCNGRPHSIVHCVCSQEDGGGNEGAVKRISRVILKQSVHPRTVMVGI